MLKVFLSAALAVTAFASDAAAGCRGGSCGGGGAGLFRSRTTVREAWGVTRGRPVRVAVRQTAPMSAPAACGSCAAPAANSAPLPAPKPVAPAAPKK